MVAPAVPVVVRMNQVIQEVPFGEGVIKLHCLQGGILGPQITLLRGNKAKVCKRAVRIGQARIGQRVRGILRDGLLKVFDALVKSLLVALVQPIAAFQIVLIGFGI